MTAAAKRLFLLFALLVSGGLTVAAPPPAAGSSAEPPATLDSPIPPGLYSTTYTEPANGLTLKYLRSGQIRRPYFVHIPPAIPGKKPALLLALHGSQRTGASMIDKWSAIADQENIVVIAPSAPGGSWNITRTEADFLLQLTAEARKIYGTAPARTYLFGHSRGAMMAIYMAARHSQDFAALSCHAGSFPVPDLERLAANIRKGTPFTFITGTDDPLFPLRAVRKTADALSETGLAVKQYEIRNHNHWYYDIAEFVNLLAWDSMKNATLPETKGLE